MPPKTHPDTDKAVKAVSAGTMTGYAAAKKYNLDPSTVYKALKKIEIERRKK